MIRNPFLRPRRSPELLRFDLQDGPGRATTGAVGASTDDAVAGSVNFIVALAVGKCEQFFCGKGVDDVARLTQGQKLIGDFEP